MNLSDIHIAVVDDDESLCRSMSRLLRASHLHSSLFSSAEAFLAWEGPQGFDCIVLDVQLDGMSGLELCRRLSGDGDSVPVIIITALDDPDVKQQAARAGCFQCFSKTDPGHDVVTAILRAVEQHRQDDR
ncbi:response regulator transcription factor [Verrucomicrobium spinosum]|uniref:response regulator transcription factor n=1 Tax=Verrucomicrobium spinosum TaxID=2736 RepID=UPI0001746824|nr:response regulator [Verrucomicrobium spinosum]